MNLRHLAALYRKFAATFGAGVAPGEAFAAIAADPGSGSLRAALQRASRLAWGGASLSAALAECRDIPAYHRSLIVQAEAAGRPDLLFQGLAVIAEKDAELQDKVKRELRMPKITLACALPFLVVLAGESLITLALAAISLGIFALVLIAEQLVLRLDGRADRWTQSIVARTPYLGRLSVTIATIRFARATAMLYDAGVVISEAVAIAADTCGNTRLRERIRPAVTRLEQGSSAAEALTETGVFPPAFAAAFRTGDATGNTDRMLNAVAEFYDQDVGVALHQFSVMLGVAALLSVGALVGLIAVTAYGGKV